MRILSTRCSSNFRLCTFAQPRSPAALGATDNPTQLLIMLARLALRTAARRQAAAALRTFTTEASSSSSSSLSAVGRDVQLKAVSRQARRQARQSEKHTGAPAAKGVRTTSLPSRISFGLLAGSITGSIAWHFLLDDETKGSIKGSLETTVLGDLYRFLAAKIEDAVRPWTDPSRAKLLPVRLFALRCAALGT